MNKQVKIIGSLILVLGMVGCGSGEPSETEMYEATQNSMLKELIGPDREDFKKGGCEKAGENTYKCSFGSKEDEGIAMNIVFTKIDGKWQAIGN